MPAKIDIDVLKSFTKSRTNETEYRQTASLNSRFTGSKCTSTCSLLKILKPKDVELLLTYEFTLQQPQGRFTSFKKVIVWKSCSYYTLIQKYN